MRKSVTYTVDNVTNISVWSDMSIHTDDDETINVKMSLADKISLRDNLSRRIKEDQRRAFESAKEAVDHGKDACPFAGDWDDC
jgi:predicted secreted protein